MKESLIDLAAKELEHLKARNGNVTLIADESGNLGLLYYAFAVDFPSGDGNGVGFVYIDPNIVPIVLPDNPNVHWWTFKQRMRRVDVDWKQYKVTPKVQT